MSAISYFHDIICVYETVTHKHKGKNRKDTFSIQKIFVSTVSLETKCLFHSMYKKMTS